QRGPPRPCGVPEIGNLAGVRAPPPPPPPGPKNALASILPSRPGTVSKASHTVSGATNVAPASITLRRARRCHAASAAASCSRELTPSASSSVQRAGKVIRPSPAAIATPPPTPYPPPPLSLPTRPPPPP